MQFLSVLRRRTGRRAPAAAVLGVALIFTACGQPGTSDRGTAERAARQRQAPHTVDVRLLNFKIDMPPSIPDGPTTFQVTNEGTSEHNFEIEGEGIQRRLDSNLRPGETRVLTVNLPPGEYHVFCPIGNHEAEGMTMKVVVTPGPHQY